MGCTLETGVFCLVPDRKIPVVYCFDCCCFIFCTSPPGYAPGDDKSEEAADRRRGLLKKACSQESAVSIYADRPWSNSTSVRTPICETKCPCPFCLVLRHVIGTQKSYFVTFTLIIQYAALGETIMPFPMTLLMVEFPSCLEVYHNLLDNLPEKNKNDSFVRLPV